MIDVGFDVFAEHRCDICGRRDRRAYSGGNDVGGCASILRGATVALFGLVLSSIFMYHSCPVDEPDVAKLTKRPRSFQLYMQNAYARLISLSKRAPHT